MRLAVPGSVALSHTGESLMQAYLPYGFFLDLDDFTMETFRWVSRLARLPWSKSGCYCSESECIWSGFRLNASVHLRSSHIITDTHGELNATKHFFLLIFYFDSIMHLPSAVSPTTHAAVCCRKCEVIIKHICRLLYFLSDCRPEYK